MTKLNFTTKTAIALYAILAVVLFFSSCTHKSELKHENGIVVEKQFSPSFDGSGTGVGFSTGGNMVVTSNDVHKAEQFMLVFKCEHNTVFAIDRKDLYTNLEKGDTVDIQYYEMLNSDNVVKDFDFVNAVKK
jgi:hypothetical protein